MLRLSGLAPRMQNAARAALTVLALILPVQALAVLPVPADRPILTVAGEITHTNDPEGALFDLDLIRDLPPRQVETTTSVTDGVQSFEGVLVRDLLALVGATGETVTARALNDYFVDIPAEDFQRFDVILAHSMNGEPLSPRGKGPLWIVYPRDDHSELQDIRYDYRWVWQLNRLEVH